VKNDWTSWWACLVEPILGAIIAFVLRGPGGGRSGTEAAMGTLSSRWHPARIGRDSKN